MTGGFRFFDTLSGELRDFEPIEPGVVRMYNCGPTVYQAPHIGNYRANTFVDVLRRSLELGGYDVRQIMNLTDVGHLTLDDIESGEDKMEAQSRRESLTAWDIAEKYIGVFYEGVDRLNWLRADLYPRATDHIPEMIEMTEALVANGHAYVTPAGNVYFSIETFPAYGDLSGNTVEELEAGARVEVVEEKRNPADFALWKRDPNHQMQWDSPWGRGFPGWHIECSAMSRKYLGDQIDIHTGGEDNVFPHHESEIAQTEGVTGKPFVRFWLHNRHLMVDGGRMGKSLGNAYTYEDVDEHGHSMRALRYFLLSTHYRQPINFTWDALTGAERAVERLDAFVRGLAEDDGAADAAEIAEACATVDRDFLAALQDDLNVSAALAAVHTFRADVNRHGVLSPADHARVRESIARIDSVLGLDLLGQGAAGDDDAEIDAMVRERDEAREAKDFARADELRDELTSRGIVLEDTPQGTRWFRG